MLNSNYSIVMFAYNEEQNITKSVSSIFNNVDDNLFKLFVLANGCTDNTVTVLNELKKTYKKLEVINLTLGDKCNAWNEYIHNIAPECNIHYFVDADVQFSDNCFNSMSQHLNNSNVNTVAIAGMPLSGRNINFYHELIIERACIFGNLYGLKHSFIQRMREEKFKLPMGLNWIDSFLTKAINTDLQFFKYNLPNRTCYLEGVGYKFDSLSIFKYQDIKLYISRIARYELGKLQEVFLDDLPVKEWPVNMHSINMQIKSNFHELSKELSTLKKHLVNKRLNKLIKNVKHK